MELHCVLETVPKCGGNERERERDGKERGLQKRRIWGDIVRMQARGASSAISLAHVILGSPHFTFP